MKIYLAAALALGLCGCSDIDLFGDSTPASEPAPMAADQSPTPALAQQSADTPAQPAPAIMASQDSAAPPPQQSAAVESEPPAVTAARAAPAPNAAVAAHCKTLAKQRAGDAAFQGEDPDTREAVYGRTYSDCVAWDAAHRS